MRNLSAGLLLCMLLSACEEMPRERPASKGTPIIRFDASQTPQMIEVRSSTGPLRLSYFASVPRGRATAINVYLIPPPVRYIYREDEKRFDYFLHYEGQLHSTPSLIQAADIARARFGSDSFIILAMPGTYGAQGDSRITHSAEIVGIVEEAIDRLKTTFGAEKVNIAAHSITSAIAVAMLQDRSDVRCVSLSSGPYDLKDFIEGMGWPTTYAGAADPISAIDIIKARDNVSSAKITLLHDERDRRVPARYSRELYDYLSAQGWDVTFAPANAVDDDHHALELVAVGTMMECAGAEQSRG